MRPAQQTQSNLNYGLDPDVVLGDNWDTIEHGKALGQGKSFWVSPFLTRHTIELNLMEPNVVMLNELS
ncbi:unnamed protein product [Sphenostylis stenocarpa]|uniref:Uncharacterized protein n=1 Tax=Sphenostylis stenocarpa TaxID=92480 RepID=A0AA86SYF3_9FABA|nr:unnamed protein product [Sphenostylis stenocarpa]